MSARSWWRRLTGYEGSMAMLMRWQFDDGKAAAAAEIINEIHQIMPPVEHDVPRGFESMADQVRRELGREIIAVACRIGGLPLSQIPDKRDAA